VRPAVFITLVGLLCPATGIAQAPAFDPIRLAEDADEAQVSWDVALAYHPQGSTGLGCDELGRYFTFVRFSSHWQSNVSASWSFQPCHKLGMTLGQSTTTLHERRLYELTESEETSTTKGFSYSSYYERRIAPGSPLDPRLRLSYRAPSGFGLAASASRVVDPVVLAGMVGLVHQHERPFNWVDVSLSAGLVANSRVSLTASGVLAVPVRDAGLPSASMGLCARYSLAASGGLQLSVQTTLHMRGQSSWIASSLSIRGRHP